MKLAAPRRGEGQQVSRSLPMPGGQDRLYREVLPRDRFEFGLGRFWCGAKVRLAFLPYTVEDLPLDLRPKKELNNPMIITSRLQLRGIAEHPNTGGSALRPNRGPLDMGR